MGLLYFCMLVWCQSPNGLSQKHFRRPPKQPCPSRNAVVVLIRGFKRPLRPIRPFKDDTCRCFDYVQLIMAWNRSQNYISFFHNVLKPMKINQKIIQKKIFQLFKISISYSCLLFFEVYIKSLSIWLFVNNLWLIMVVSGHMCLFGSFYVLESF